MSICLPLLYFYLLLLPLFIFSFSKYSSHMFLHSLVDIVYIVSPGLAFLPQIMSGEILFSPLLSLLTVLTSLLKLSHYHYEPYSLALLYQYLFAIILHLYMIRNYKQPLRTLELKVFEPNICTRYGLLIYSVTLLAGSFTLLNFVALVHSAYLLAYFACFIELLVTSLQLFIYADGRKKPREVFALWIAGDLARLWMMAFHYNTNVIYVIVVIVQIIMNLYVFIN